MYQDVWQCLRTPTDASTLGQVAKGACSNLTACVAVYTPSPRPGTAAYVMVFASKQDLDNVQSCADRDRGVVTPTWGQDPNGEYATCFTKVAAVAHATEDPASESEEEQELKRKQKQIPSAEKRFRR